MSKKTLVQVYYALVHSKLIYGILSWRRASKSAIKPLIVLKNRVVKAIYRNGRRYDATLPLYHSLNLLEIPELFKLELPKFMFNHNKSSLPKN